MNTAGEDPTGGAESEPRAAAARRAADRPARSARGFATRAERALIVRTICRPLIGELGSPACTVYTLDRERRVLQRLVTVGRRVPADHAAAVRPLAGEPRLLRAVVSAEPVRASGALIVPLVHSRETVGVIELIEPNGPDAVLVDPARALKQCAPLAAMMRVFAVGDRLARQNVGLQAISETLEALTLGLDEIAILNDLARHLAEVLGVRRCDIYTESVDEPEKMSLAARYEAGRSRGVRAGDESYKLTEKGARALAATARRVTCAYLDDPELLAVDRAAMMERGIRAVMNAPILYEDAVLGVLSIIETRESRRFSDEDEQLATSIAHKAAIVINNARINERMRQQNAELKLVIEAGEAIASSVDLSETLATITERLTNMLGAAWSDFYALDAERNEMVALSFYQIPELPIDSTSWVGTRYAIDTWPAWQDFMHELRAAVLYSDHEGLTLEAAKELDRWGEKSSLTVPLVSQSKLIGLLDVAESRYMRRFTDDDIRVATAIANQAAAAISNARLFEEIKERNAALADFNQRLTAFVDVSGEVRGLMDEASVLQLLGRVMSESLQFQQWTAWLNDEAAGVFIAAAAYSGKSTPDKDLGRIVPSGIIAGLVDASTKISHSFFVDSRRHVWTQAEQTFLPGGLDGERGDDEWQSDDTLFVPMIGERQQLIGYIEAYDPADRQLPSESIVRLLEVFAGKAAAAIELHRVYEQLELQATTDGLTTLHNHRVLDERLDAEVARALRTNEPLSVLMIDIDDFKKFNDTYGHPQGDKLLRGLADILLGNTRQKIDLVARYGGEEFCIVLPATLATAAEATAERLRVNLADMERTAAQVAEDIRSSTEAQFFEGSLDSSGVRVTVSIGVACLPEHGTTAAELVGNADKALYLAKRAGKNRICVYSE